MNKNFLHKKILVKICGISETETLNHCYQLGVNWVGFVFFKKSPRHLSFEKASELRMFADKNFILKDYPKKVALTVDADDEYLNKIDTILNPEMFQLHGNETPSRCKFIRENFRKPVMKVIKVKNKKDILNSNNFKNYADWILFDSFDNYSSIPGGNGKTFDWSLFRDCSIELPWMLAGGLKSNNVNLAIQYSGAKCVDVSSGVEIKKGKKSAESITAFINATKNKNLINVS